MVSTSQGPTWPVRESTKGERTGQPAGPHTPTGAAPTARPDEAREGAPLSAQDATATVDGLPSGGRGRRVVGSPGNDPWPAPCRPSDPQPYALALCPDDLEVLTPVAWTVLAYLDAIQLDASAVGHGTLALARHLGLRRRAFSDACDELRTLGYLDSRPSMVDARVIEYEVRNPGRTRPALAVEVPIGLLVACAPSGAAGAHPPAPIVWAVIKAWQGAAPNARMSLVQIAEEASTSRRTATRCIADLERLGWLRVARTMEQQSIYAVIDPSRKCTAASLRRARGKAAKVEVTSAHFVPDSCPLPDPTAPEPWPSSFDHQSPPTDGSLVAGKRRFKRAADAAPDAIVESCPSKGQVADEVAERRIAAATADAYAAAHRKRWGSEPLKEVRGRVAGQAKLLARQGATAALLGEAAALLATQQGHSNLVVAFEQVSGARRSDRGRGSVMFHAVNFPGPMTEDNALDTL